MYYVDENIKNLYRVKCHDKRDTYLRLDMNENPEGLPKDFVDYVLKKVTPELISMYPDKSELISLIAKQNNINEDSISVTNGSEEAIRLILETFGEKNKEVITVMPTFELYDVYCKMFGLNHISVSYDENFNIPIDNIIEKVNANTRIVVLLNPNSPIGNVYKENEVIRIIEKALTCNAVVMIDEAYHYFCSKSYIDLVNKYDNVLVLRTFSKLCSMAGARLGYVTGNKEIIHYIDNAQSTYNVNSLAILFAEELLKQPKLMEELIEKEKEGHDYLASKLKDNNYKYYSLCGNYLIFKSKIPPDELINKMKERGILIRAYRTGLIKDWIRVTTGKKEFMERFWKELINIEG
jgi:histidinol-phosphate aminotransferase